MSANPPVVTCCPNCKEHFINSSLLRESKALLRLKCENCDKEYSLGNSDKQRERLSTHYGVPSQIVQLQNIEQLRVGNAISFKRSLYQHHAIVVNIDITNKKVEVVEYDPNRAGSKSECIRRNTLRFREDIAEKNAWLRQYMPLDCFPRSEVVRRANTFVDNRDSQPEYFFTEFNCQHLTSFCKTGKSISEEAAELNKVCFQLMNSIRVASFLRRPAITYGICGLDSLVRLTKVCTTSMDQIEKGVADPTCLTRDAGQLLINALGIASQKSGLMANIWRKLSSRVYWVSYHVTAIYVVDKVVDTVDFLWGKVEKKTPDLVRMPVNFLLGGAKMITGTAVRAIDKVTDLGMWAVDKVVPSCVKKVSNEILDAGIKVVQTVCAPIVKSVVSVAFSIWGFFKSWF